MNKLASYFISKTRDSGESFVTLTDERPDWLQEAVYAAHQNAMPCDWIYAECFAVCEAIDAGDFAGRDPSDALHEHADRRVDVYTKDLFQWAADMCLTSVYAEAEESAVDVSTEQATIVERLTTIQYYAISSIAGTIYQAWEEHQDGGES